MSRQLWNPEIETLTREQLCELEGPLIADQVDYVYQNSPYYRNKYDQAGIDPGGIASHQALSGLPFTEKSDITAMQRQVNFNPAIELVRHDSIATEHKTHRLYRSYLDDVAPVLEILYRE